MTKILDVTSGEYLVFVTSRAYDKKVPIDTSNEETIIWENSFNFEINEVIEDWLTEYIDPEETRNQFEIIYD